MKSMFRIVFILLLMALPAQAQVNCPAKPIGDINVVWGSEKIEYDFTKSQSQMDRMDIDTKSPYDRHTKTHVGGLMKGGISVESKIQVASLTYPRSRQTCQWIDNMDVTIRIDPKIYIARDHKQGTCRHKAILDHEMKHVFVDREIVKKYIPVIQAELRTAIRKVGIVGPKAERDQRRYQKKISDYMDKRLKLVSEKMYTERGERQQAIDTLAEYERVASLCR
jgi:hypothetical protein